MNIKRAKQEIRDSIEAYLSKDEFGEYRIPAIRQRPILLMGPPGIGKTQIMEQAARECGVALVAYTITHHTRQSAIGLPFISKKEYGGREYSATEYTMSEIVASIYDRMRETGLTEGILFIDEINCVSETLAPAMLQFLQCKTFGNHEIPKGWVIVAAGNPPEYNKSVRDFDVVTLDRVKKITVEPDYRVWKEYAFKENIHPAILSYLELRNNCFYQMETTIDGKTISFKAPYRRLPILDAIKEKTGYDLNGKSEEEIRQICRELKMEIDDTMGKGKLIDEIFGEFCEGTFIQPTFITDYPVEMSPLTKMHRSKPGLTERFELMVNGKELANAYSELNDPIDQEERFKEQLKLSEKGDDEAMFIDQDFLKALQYGMPPTSGIGIGIDRLTMLMTGQPFIQEVLFFPQMRPEKVTPKDAPAKFMELGIPEEWVAVIQKAGYNMVGDMKDVNPQKLHMDICGINKKYKLELANPTVKDVEGWVEKI